MDIYDDIIMSRWKEFLNEGNKRKYTPKRHYRGSPIEPNGHSKATNKKYKDERRKRVATMGMTEPFSDDEKELLNTNALYEDELVEKDDDKKKKELCKPVNPYHSQTTGKFTSKDEPGSWSVDYGGSGGPAGCERGVLRKPGSSQHKVWTKPDECGRRGPELCGTKDKKRKPYRTKGKLESLVRSELENILSEYSNWINSQTNLDETVDDKQLYRMCRKKFNLLSFNDFLLAQQKLVASSKGDLFKQKKA